MVNFKLTNVEQDDWFPDEFVRIDTGTEKRLERIVLIVDWAGKGAKIETVPSYQVSVPNDMYGASKTFQLPFNIDASKFPAYYDENILPILQEMRTGFVGGFVEIYKTGNFDFGEPIETKGRREIKYYAQIQELIWNAPRHDGVYHWSLAEVYPSSSDLFLKLESDGIDLVETPLRTIEKVREIRELLEKDCTFLMDDETFTYALLDAQRGVDYETRKNVNMKKRVNAIRSRKIDRFFGDAETVNHFTQPFNGA